MFLNQIATFLLLLELLSYWLDQIINPSSDRLTIPRDWARSAEQSLTPRPVAATAFRRVDSMVSRLF